MRKGPRRGRAPFAATPIRRTARCLCVVLYLHATPSQVSGRLIGEARHAKLLAECNADPALAYESFIWNVRAAGAALEAIHVFELVLRNAIDQQLRVWHHGLTGTPDWLVSPHPFVLQVVPQSRISEAVARASKLASEKGRPAIHDDVVAQLSLGVWRYILPSNANKTKQRLWREATAAAFPHWRGTWDPQSLVTRVANAHALRNCVAHLEPLHSMTCAGFDATCAVCAMPSVQMLLRSLSQPSA